MIVVISTIGQSNCTGSIFSKSKEAVGKTRNPNYELPESESPLEKRAKQGLDTLLWYIKEEPDNEGYKEQYRILNEALLSGDETELANALRITDARDNQQENLSQYQMSDLTRQTAGLAEYAGSQLPAMAMGSLFAPIQGIGAGNKVAQKIASSATTLLGSAGEATTKALQQDVDYGTARIYGGITGAVQAATRMLASGVPGMDNGVIPNAIKFGLDGIATSPVGSTAISCLSNALGEGVTRAIATIATPIIEKLTINNDLDVLSALTDGRVWEAFIGGVISSLVMQLPNLPNEYRNQVYEWHNKSIEFVYQYIDPNEIHSAEELKKVYRELAKQYHSDIGGTDEAMAQINIEHDRLLEQFGKESSLPFIEPESTDIPLLNNEAQELTQAEKAQEVL